MFLNMCGLGCGPQGAPIAAFFTVSFQKGHVAVHGDCLDTYGILERVVECRTAAHGRRIDRPT
jgi:hypothetical protein